MGLVASPQLPCPHCAFSCEKQEVGTFGSSAAPSTLNIYLGVQVRALEPKKFTAGEGGWPGFLEWEDLQLRQQKTGRGGEEGGPERMGSQWAVSFRSASAVSTEVSVLC